MQIVDDRSALTPSETKVFRENSKKTGKDSDNRFAYLFDDNKAEYKSEEYEGASFYVAEKMFADKVQHSIKIIKDVPSMIVSDGADNGDLIDVGDFYKQLKSSLSLIKKGSSVSEIKIDISIVTRGGSAETNNMLPYILKAKAKIERQIQQTTQGATNVDKSKIKVNVSAKNGNSADSKTTIIIK